MLDPLPSTIPHAAMVAAKRWGDAPALIERGETWSFNRLWRESIRAAGAFTACGMGRGERVAIWAPNSREWIVAAVAAMLCGAAIVPLNTRLKGREAGDILRRAHVKLLVTVSSFLGQDYPALLKGEDLPDLKGILLLDDGWDALLADAPLLESKKVEAMLGALSADDVSDIIFTSGTTGRPKGVLMTYGRVIPQCGVWIRNTRLGEGERYLIANPFFHSYGLKVGWVAALLAGAVTVPMAQFDVRQAARLIEEQRINFLPGPPTIFQMLLDELEERPFDTTSLRGGTTGAATVPPVLVERIRTELGIKDIITAYGMTECVTITSCLPGDPADLIAHSCGAPIPGNDVRIVGEDGQELARGKTGEIIVRGQGVMLGYLDEPEATAAAIDPEGWLHTGDVGTMDERGYVRITDRKKDLYISGGFNCYPAEIEKLLSLHPAISMVAVIGVPDERMGEVGKAFVVRRPGASLEAPELLAWARENMANYKVPRQFQFLEELPRNASGKVTKLALQT